MKSKLLAVILHVVLIRTLAHAEICTSDVVPAATLLVPYFESDVKNCADEQVSNTLVRITNLSAATTLAHVTFWTNLGVPTFAFDVPLIGYDIETLNLKNIFCKGEIPDSASAFPQPLTQTSLEHYRAWHTGSQSQLTGNCAALPDSNGNAVGYITIDSVSEKGLGFPSDGQSYFSKTSVQNVLIGDIYYQSFETVEETVVNITAAPPLVNKKKCSKKNLKKREKCRIYNKIVKRLPKQPDLTNLDTQTVVKARPLNGIPAIHIEAFESLAAPDKRTFYGKYVSNGADKREPLASIYSVQYRQGLPADKFELAVWREAKQKASPFSCGGLKPNSDLKIKDAIGFDENSNATNLIASLEKSFPILTQIAGNILNAVPADNGWIYLVFNESALDMSQAAVIRRRSGVFDSSGVSVLSPGCNETP